MCFMYLNPRDFGFIVGVDLGFLSVESDRVEVLNETSVVRV